MKLFSKNRSISLALMVTFVPLAAVAQVEAPAVAATQPDFRGQFESHDISSSGKWVLEFKSEHGQWSGRANISNGKWAKIEGVKVDGNKIEFYMNSKPISNFKASIDGRNFLLSGTQEIGDGRKNTFNNVFLPFTATRI
jgi:hypothetical protein